MAERITGRLTVVDAANREVLDFDARFAVLDLGAAGNEGDLRIHGDDGQYHFHFDGGRQLFVVRDAAGRDVLSFQAANSQMRVGAQGNDGDVYVMDGRGEASIHLDGGAGDIILRNADCAEEFDVADGDLPPPGTLVVLDADGAVRACTAAYDRRVAGVVSGAGGYRPAIVLDRRTGRERRVPVAVIGKVCCKADASAAPIAVGDLLTTSTTSGHAMRADDRARAFGAVAGKALGPLSAGTGLVPMLAMLR